MAKAPLSQLVDPDARTRIKLEARRLFAESGFRNVTVREIAAAAGQKNHGAVGYYFGTKEALAKEILIDGAMQIEAHRNAMLDQFEVDGTPVRVLQLLEAIIIPSVDLETDRPGEAQYFNRFLLDLSYNHPKIIDDALEGRWNIGYQRCLKHLRRLMPELTPAEKNRRFVFLGAYVATILATREAMLADKSRVHSNWRSDAMLKDIVATATALLLAPRFQD